MQTNILDAIGQTPLVKLGKLAEGIQATVALKLESLNPGGSVKDRMALAMIQEAERNGTLKPGGTIIEATAGNTGVGLAMAAAVHGYRCIFVLPDKMSKEKISLLKAYGAEVVITPTSVAPDSPESYNGVANRLAREIAGAWRPDQFRNFANPNAHYHSTGPEIWDQTKGRVTTFVAGVGTGGTLTGIASYLKERNPNVRIVGADPEGSVLSGDSPKPWKVEGIGEDFVPKTFNSQLVDEWVRVSDREAFHIARELARKEGILAGGSTGVNLAAALRIARRSKPGDLIVTVCCDTGRNYLSKFFDDEWLEQNNLNWSPSRRRFVSELLEEQGATPLISVTAGDLATTAIRRMREGSISQIPVLEEGRSIGTIHEISIARNVRDGVKLDELLVGQIMASPLPEVEPTSDVDEVYRLLLSGNPAVVVVNNKQAVGILSRIDLVQSWSDNSFVTRTQEAA
jgi:cystathionine beta-synthase